MKQKKVVSFNLQQKRIPRKESSYVLDSLKIEGQYKSQKDLVRNFNSRLSH